MRRYINKSMSTFIFRKSQQEKRQLLGEGEILLYPRLNHTIVLSFLLLWFLGIGLWLTLSSFDKTVTVSGWVEPVGGVIRIFPDGTGIVKKVLVTDGETVERNDPLIVMDGRRILSDGAVLEDVLLLEYQKQRDLVEAHIARQHKIYDTKQRNLTQQIAAAEEQLLLFDQQLRTLTARIELVETRLANLNVLAERSAASPYDTEQAQEAFLRLTSEKQDLLRNESQHRDAIHELEAQRELAPQEFNLIIEQLNSELSVLTQKIAEHKGATERIIRTPISGRASLLEARVGSQVNTSVPLMTVLPETSSLSGNIYVPVRSAGLVKVGQRIKIRYDAFPHQKFGLFEGTISHVGTSVLMPHEIVGPSASLSEPVYLVVCDLDSRIVEVNEQPIPVKSGMTFTADIVIHQMTLAEWVLEPILGLRGR